MRVTTVQAVAIVAMAVSIVGTNAQTLTNATPNGSHVIQGNFEDGVTADGFLADNSNSKRVGVGGAGGNRRVNVPLWGLDLPPIPAGESLTGATLSFPVESIAGSPLYFDMVVSLMNTANISEFTDADEFVEATAALGSVLSNGIVFAQFAESEIIVGETLEVPVTGAALTQLNSLYDASGNPTQSTVWFRLSPSVSTTYGAGEGGRVQFVDDGSGGATFNLELNWGALPEDIYYVATTPASWADGAAWSDGNPASSANDYFVTNNVTLKTPTNTASFPGISLNLVESQTVELMVSGTDVITFPSLDLSGDTLRAGAVGTNLEAKVDGTLNVSGNSTLGGASNSRDLRVLAQVTGASTVTLQAPGNTIYIDNAGNTFDGTWNLTGNFAEFASPAAVGAASIQLGNFGKLRILGDWNGLGAGGSLTVADSANAVVEVGANAWKVSALTVGSSNVVDSTVYTVEQLNAIGANPVFSGTGTIQVGTLPPPPPDDLIVGIDTFDSTSAPTPTFTAADISAAATASGPDGNWNTSTTEARGSSIDGTWGTFDGNGNPAGTSTTLAEDCISLLNGRGGEITLSITNSGPGDINLGSIHFDALAFRPKAARTYSVNVLAGSDVTEGIVFTSADQAITSIGGNLDGSNDQHDDIDVSLAGLADSTLEAGGVAVIQLTFTGGTLGSAGHHLWLDNLGISSAANTGPVEPPVMDAQVSGGNMTIIWTSDGDFKLQTRSNLVFGDWVDVPGATASPVVLPATNDVEFLRLIEQ